MAWILVKFKTNGLFFFFLHQFSGYPGNHSEDQAGLRLRDPFALAFQVLGLKTCTTMPSLNSLFNIYYWGVLCVPVHDIVFWPGLGVK